MQNSTKNPPWARSNVNSNMTGMNAQMMDPTMAMGQQGMMPFQQTYNPNLMQQQGSIGMPMANQMQMNQMAQGQMYPGNVVAYPTPRAINPMYQNNQGNQSQANPNEQRVFTGVVTKTHNDFGFVDHDVFYQTSVCAKGAIPKVNDRVLVEATFNPNMPFKWNATRVQVLPKNNVNNKSNPPIKSNNYTAVPPPKKSLPTRRDDRPPRREERKRSRSRTRSRSRDRKDSRRRDSPVRKRPVVHQPSPPKYVVRVPRMPLDIAKLDVPSLSQRYNNLYIPSDFFSAQVRWGETFPPQNPFPLNNSCAYYIMNKEVENPSPNDAVLEPSDADYKFSAKVMLISLPSLESLYRKCGLTKDDEKDKDKDKRSSGKNALHPTRLIKFLVGQKGKGGENFAIGGPWSPSLDGENPQSDPTVLVKTAIRTCKALTGIDLSSCTQWYRMVEFYYWRESSSGAGRTETVVLFLPDVWSAVASRADWSTTTARYQAACELAVAALDAPAPPVAAAPNTPQPDTADSHIENTENNDSTITIDGNEEEDEDRPDPTHYLQLDMKTIKVDQLRQELRARKVSSKGLRPQLISRLSKLLKSEEAKENNKEDKDEVMVVDEEEREPPKETETPAKDDKSEEKKEKEGEKKEKTEKEKEEDKKKLEKEKQTLKHRYELPSTPHFIVHPSPTAKGGKFNCTVATVSLLLDYRITDNKEHSFELFVFAELFNEMLMRDFGFYIYKTLYTLPEKVEDKEKSDDKKDEKAEKKDEKSEKKDEKSEKKDEKSDKKDEKSDKKEDKGDKKDEKSDKKDDKSDKRDSRRRERRDSHSDDERSSSPRQKSRGVDLPPDPYLLLALVYFDTTRCNYITKKDLQNLFVSLGLQLSRSQIRSILEKVCIKDNFNYKTLSQAIKDLSSGTVDVLQDLPLNAPVTTEDVPPHVSELEACIASGNRNLLPVFRGPSAAAAAAAGDAPVEGSKVIEVPEGGMIMYNSRVVDVSATLSALSRAGRARAALEAALAEARGVARTMRAAAAQTQAASRTSLHQLTHVTEELSHANKRIASLTASTKIFHSALKSIQSKVDAVINIKYEEEDDVVEVVNGPAKVEKKESKEEVKPEEKPVVEEAKAGETKESQESQPEPEAAPVEESAANEDEKKVAEETMELDDKE